MVRRSSPVAELARARLGQVGHERRRARAMSVRRELVLRSSAAGWQHGDPHVV